ncbi:MAG: hypothetical protein ACYDBB_08955 [Armatimonadota bacterium]
MTPVDSRLIGNKYPVWCSWERGSPLPHADLNGLYNLAAIADLNTNQIKHLAHDTGVGRRQVIRVSPPDTIGVRQGTAALPLLYRTGLMRQGSPY